MSDNENALVATGHRNFKMPDFGNSRVNHLKNKLDKLNQHQDQDVIEHCGSCAERTVTKQADCIANEEISVDPNQNDVTEFVIKENAKIKKKELEDKIKKMALVDNIFSAQEAKEKIEHLEKNADLLRAVAGPSSPDSKSKLKDLEHELGVAIVDDEPDVSTLKDPMRETKNTFKKNQEQAEEFVKKINDEKKKQEQKLHQIRKKELEKYRKLESSRKEKKEKLDEEARLKKEKRLQEKLERKERERQAKQQRDEEWKKFIAKKKQNQDQYLHEKLEKEYNEKVLMPELEQKKMALKAKRDFCKPIDHKEIDEFQKQYEEKIKVKLEEKRIKREKWYDEIGAGQYDPNKYKTKVLEKVIESEKGNEESKQHQIEDKKRKAEKMKNYAKIVKQMHWPEASSKKHEEIERIKKLLGERNKRRSAPPKKRNQYQAEEENNTDYENKSKYRRPVWNFHNPLVPKPKPKHEPVVVDYLKELRIKREENDQSSRHETGANWKNIKDQNMDDKTKIELLKARTKLIEENAERKEKMNKLKGSSVEDNVDINDMLIDAIEMKLSILDNID